MAKTLQTRLLFTAMVTMREFEICIFLPSPSEHYLKHQTETHVLSNIYFYISFCPEDACQCHLPLHKKVLECLILLVRHHFSFQLCLTSLENSRCAGEGGNKIYAASTVSAKIKPTQRIVFFTLEHAEGLTFSLERCNFSSRSRGQVTNLTQNQALQVLTTSQYSSEEHLGHIILSHPIWMQFFQGYKFIRETDCKQTQTHTRRKYAGRFCLLTLHIYDCLTQKPKGTAIYSLGQSCTQLPHRVRPLYHRAEHCTTFQKGLGVPPIY